MEVVTTSVSRYGFTEATAGTCERGAAERARQDALVQAAGGMCSYLQGARPTIDKDATMTWREVRTNDERLQGRIQGGL